MLVSSRDRFDDEHNMLVTKLGMPCDLCAQISRATVNASSWVFQTRSARRYGTYFRVVWCALYLCLRMHASTCTETPIATACSVSRNPPKAAGGDGAATPG